MPKVKPPASDFVGLKKYALRGEALCLAVYLPITVLATALFLVSWSAGASILSNGNLKVFSAVILVVTGGLGGLLQWLLLGRYSKPHPSIQVVGPDAYPGLYSQVAKVSSQTGAPLPHLIAVSEETQASYQFYYPKWQMSGLALLTLGKEVLEKLSIDERLGVIAHELAHGIVHQRVGFLHSRELLRSLIRVDARLIGPLRYFKPSIHLLMLSLTRQEVRRHEAEEFFCDALAAKYIGRDVYETALRKVHEFECDRSRVRAEEFLAEEVKAGKFDQEVAAEVLTEYMKHVRKRRLDRDPGAYHPSYLERSRAIQAIPKSKRGAE